VPLNFYLKLLFQLTHLGRIACEECTLPSSNVHNLELSFGRTYRLNLQGQRLGEARNPRDGGVKKSSASRLFFTHILLGLFFNTKD
jgi:hypothetical protein